jgi:hypothetical protein
MMLKNAQIILAVALLVSCGGGEPVADYFHWDVTVKGVDDTCNEPPQGYIEQMTYALAFQGSVTDLALFEDEDYNTFASGVLGGCKLTYESPTVKEERSSDPEDWIQWRLSGESWVQQGGSGCSIETHAEEILELIPNPTWESLDISYAPSEIDWVGLETFEVMGVGASIEGIEAGCSYTVLVAGVYTGG